MKYTCPVCAFTGLDEPPEDFTICPSCGTEFDYHDLIRGHDELRARWVANGFQWHSTVIPAPAQWNGIEQLRTGGYLDYAADVEKSQTKTEVGIVEIGGGTTMVRTAFGMARFSVRDYAIGQVVNVLGWRLEGAHP